jgi:hypothetical protein
MTAKETSNGSTANYYMLPIGMATLNELAVHKKMNPTIAKIFIIAYIYANNPPNVYDMDDVANMVVLIPKDATQLQHLIAYKNMNGQIAEIFRALYRYGQVSHSPEIRDANKILYYINAELERLEKYGDFLYDIRILKHLMINANNIKALISQEIESLKTGDS